MHALTFGMHDIDKTIGCVHEATITFIYTACQQIELISNCVLMICGRFETSLGSTDSLSGDKMESIYLIDGRMIFSYFIHLTEHAFCSRTANSDMPQDQICSTVKRLR